MKRKDLDLDSPSILQFITVFTVNACALGTLNCCESTRKGFAASKVNAKWHEIDNFNIGQGSRCMVRHIVTRDEKTTQLRVLRTPKK